LGRKGEVDGDALAPSPWLTLGQASRTLGVTPNTLRRWADSGEVPSFTTPGGHRRFLISVVQALLPASRTRRPALTTLGASPDYIARAYRRARTAPAHGHVGWQLNLSDAERGRFRERGTRLVGDLVAYLDAPREDTKALLATAEVDAKAYGAAAAGVGVSLSDTVEGFLRFRKPFVDQLATLARRKHLDTREATALLVDAETALDRLLVALMDGHRAAGPHA
jgi:excisionase family DNA binding protein